MFSIEKRRDTKYRKLFIPYRGRTEPKSRLSGEKAGFDFEEAITNGLLTAMHLDLEKHTIRKQIDEEIRTGKYAQVAVDSLTPRSEMPD